MEQLNLVQEGGFLQVVPATIDKDDVVLSEVTHGMAVAL